MKKEKKTDDDAANQHNTATAARRGEEGGRLCIRAARRVWCRKLMATLCGTQWAASSGGCVCARPAVHAHAQQTSKKRTRRRDVERGQVK